MFRRRRRVQLSSLCLATVCASACGAGCATHPDDDVGELANADDAPPTPEADEAANWDVYESGDAHVALINMVAASADASAALTADTLGQVRYWAAVDGSETPKAVPVHAPNTLDLGATGEGSHRLAFVDAAGGAQVFEAAPGSNIEEVFELPPTRPLRDLRIAPRAAQLHVPKASVALTKDRHVLLVDAAGTVVDSWSQRSFPIEALEVHDGRIFVAARLADAKGAYTQVQELVVAAASEGPRLDAKGDAIRIEGTPRRLQWDLERGRIWVLEAGASGGISVIREVRIDGETGARFSISSALTDQVRLGLDHRGWPVLESPNVGTKAVDPATGRMHALSLRADGGLGSTWAGGKRFGGFGTHLGVEGIEAGERVYLGFRPVNGHFAAVSPDATRIAWARAGELRIERSEGAKVLRVERPFDLAPMGLAWSRHGSIAVASWSGALELLDGRDGSRIDELDAGGTFSDWRVHPSGAAASWRTQSWGTRHVVPLDAGGFGEARSVEDGGSAHGPIAQSDGFGLWTYDGSHLSMYSAAQLAAGQPVDASTTSTVTKIERPAPNASLALPVGDATLAWASFSSSPARSEIALSDRKGEGSRTVQLDNGVVTWLAAGPRGRRVFATTDADGRRTLHAIDLASASKLWSHPVPNDALVTFAASAPRLLVASPSAGAMMLSIDEGQRVWSRCAFEFEVRRSAPVSVGAATQDLCQGP